MKVMEVNVLKTPKQCRINMCMTLGYLTAVWISLKWNYPVRLGPTKTFLKYHYVWGNHDSGIFWASEIFYLSI